MILKSPLRKPVSLTETMEAKVAEAVAKLGSKAGANDIHKAAADVMNEISPVPYLHYGLIVEAINAGVKGLPLKSPPLPLPRFQAEQPRVPSRFVTSVAASAAAMARLEDDAPVFEAIPTNIQPLPACMPNGQFVLDI